MEEITYDTQNDTISVQPPAPAPIVYTRDDIQGKINEYENARGFEQAQADEHQQKADDWAAKRDEQQALIDGLDNAKAVAP